MAEITLSIKLPMSLAAPAPREWWVQKPARQQSENVAIR